MRELAYGWKMANSEFWVGLNCGKHRMWWLHHVTCIGTQIKERFYLFVSN